MFTAEQLETTWKQMSEYEKDNFGLRFGPDFAAIANTLRQNKGFMTAGGVCLMLGSLEISGIASEMRAATTEAQKTDISKGMLERPSTIHNTMAELFYLGYQLGRQSKEVDALESLATRSQV